MAKIIGILSGKGGVGKTTFASNLGIALSNFGKRVVVIDCNITSPHLAYYLGARDYSITLNNVLRGDVDIRFAPLYQSGVLFIPCSEDIKDVMRVDIFDLKKYVGKLAEKNNYDYIILDSAPGLGREALSVLRACDEIIFVTTPTIPNIADITRCAEVAGQFGHKRFNIVLNMVRGKEYELKAKDAESFFRNPVLGIIPFDENVIDSTAQGIPILWYKPNSSVCKSFMNIAANFIGVKYKKPSIFQRLKNFFRK